MIRKEFVAYCKNDECDKTFQKFENSKKKFVSECKKNGWIHCGMFCSTECKDEYLKKIEENRKNKLFDGSDADYMEEMFGNRDGFGVW